jgi:hypothetical protein
MRITTLALLTIGCLGLAGCAPTQTRTYTITGPTSAPATWTGRSMDEVLETWGPPSVRESDGQDGTLVVYQDKSAVSTSVSESAPSPPDLDPHAGAQPMRVENLKKVQAKFWLDKQGKVYRFWFSPEVYKKGTDTPPAKKSENEED